MTSWIPHIGAFFNLVVTTLIIWGIVAIRRGDRELHPKLMKGALLFGLLFLVSYVLQLTLLGHSRFQGQGTIRMVFFVILISHTILAVATPPLVLRAAYLGIRERFEEHRRLVRIAAPVWLYVGVTGIVIYAMNHFLPV